MSIGIFEGDGRLLADGSAFFDRSDTRYRTRQVAALTPLIAGDIDGIKDGSVHNYTGITKLYDEETSVDSQGHISAAAKGDNVIDSQEYLWNRNLMLLDIGQASTSGMHIAGERISATKVKYTIDMAADNPLVWIYSPDIDADLELTIDYSDLYNVTYILTGAHDGFPCYDLFINNQLIYDEDSGVRNPSALLGGEDISVNQVGNIDL